MLLVGGCVFKSLKYFLRKFYHFISFLSVFCLFFLFTSNVKAEMPTGEQYSEFDTHRVQLLGIYTSSTNFQLYGYNWAGMSPTLDSFLDGRTSLVRYYNNTNDTYSNWGLWLYTGANIGAGTYSLSWTNSFVDSNSARAFCNKASSFTSVRAGQGSSIGRINSSTCSTSGVNAYVLVNFTTTSATTNPYFDISSSDLGMSANWFLRLATASYFPQINVSDYLDTSSLEAQNNHIISQNERIINEERQQNEKLDKINDTMNDSSVDSPNNSIDSLKSNLPTNTVISDLILLPVTFLQNLVSSLNGSCSAFSLGSLLGTNLSMPCINLESYLGSTIWTFIDIVLSGMFVLIIRKKFVDIFQNITNLKNGGNEVE